jgi:hypothetical protein
MGNESSAEEDRDITDSNCIPREMHTNTQQVFVVINTVFTSRSLFTRLSFVTTRQPRYSATIFVPITLRMP